MSYSRDLKEQFIQLRARGISFPKIAEQLKVSRRTLQYWAQALKEDVWAAHRAMLEESLEKFGINQLGKVEEVGAQLAKVREAIKARDFGKEKLRDLYAAQKLLEDRLGAICTL